MDYFADVAEIIRQRDSITSVDKLAVELRKLGWVRHLAEKVATETLTKSEIVV